MKQATREYLNEVLQEAIKQKSQFSQNEFSKEITELYADVKHRTPHMFDLDSFFKEHETEDCQIGFLSGMDNASFIIASVFNESQDNSYLSIYFLFQQTMTKIATEMIARDGKAKGDEV